MRFTIFPSNINFIVEIVGMKRPFDGLKRQKCWIVRRYLLTLRVMRKGNYFELWYLLATAFLTVVVLSCFDKPKIGSVEIRHSGIAEKLTRQPEPESELMAETDAPVKADTVAAKPEESDTASHVILFIGDSMLETLGPRMASYAKANDHKLHNVIWYSSSTKIWAESNRIPEYIKKFHPTYIMISLGGNELFLRDVDRQRRPYIEKILQQIGDIPYLWIGPPNWKKDTGINKLIASMTKPGCFFLSDGMHFERKKDGAHPTKESAALWMDSIARWWPRRGAHPIKMELPKERYARATSQEMLKPLE